jgi:hypothetical protein
MLDWKYHETHGKRFMRLRFAFFAALVAFSMAETLVAAPRPEGQLELEVVDAATGQPIPARLHLLNSRKRPVKLNLPDTAEFAGHFYVDGTLSLPLRRGQFTFEIDAGPEYRTQTGHFEIDRFADDSKKIEMTRFANLAREGWYAADLDFNRPARELPLIFRAEHLQNIELEKFATVLPTASPQSANRKPQAEIRIAAVPYAWDLPVWLASGDLTAILLIHRHALRDGVVDNEDDGRPRDGTLFPGDRGNGRWSEAVYHHVLNCGLRIPPAAGSGSGFNDNPVGTNRIYVHCGDSFSPEAWWEGLEQGRVFVTNGPLLRPVVEGQPPGHVFHIDGNETLSLEIGLNLATRVPVDYLEIVKDGEVYANVRLDEFKQKKGHLPPVEFDDSGWFLVRAVTNNSKNYQFASSGPYYVEKAGKPHIGRRSVQFFLDWIDAAEDRVRKLPKLSESQRNSLLAEQAKAREFFQKLLQAAGEHDLQ